MSRYMGLAPIYIIISLAWGSGRWYRQKPGKMPDWRGKSVKPARIETRDRSDSRFDLGTGHGEGRC